MEEKNKKYRCISCNAFYYIEIKMVKFCEDCFKKSMIRKIRKQICLNNNNNYLIRTKNSLPTNVMLHLIGKHYEKNSKKKFYVFEKTEFKNLIFVESKINLENDDEVARFCVENKIGIVMEALSIEDVVQNSLILFLNGKGKDAIESSQTKIIENVRFVNVFAKVSNLEINGYYFPFRNEIAFQPSSLNTSPFYKACSRLLKEICDRNAGAYNNFVEVLRRLKLE